MPIKYPNAIDDDSKQCSKCRVIKNISMFHVSSRSKDGHKPSCKSCVKKFEHVDHVISLKRGGKHCLANLRPSCAFCNLSKHNKKLDV